MPGGGWCCCCCAVQRVGRPLAPYARVGMAAKRTRVGPAVAQLSSLAAGDERTTVALADDARAEADARMRRVYGDGEQKRHRPQQGSSSCRRRRLPQITRKGCCGVYLTRCHTHAALRQPLVNVASAGVDTTVAAAIAGCSETTVRRAQQLSAEDAHAQLARRYAAPVKRAHRRCRAACI